MLKGYKILVTGVGGFIGRALAEKLKPHNSVYGLDLNLDNAPNGIFLIETDIRDYTDSLDYDYIFHFASPCSQLDFIKHNSTAYRDTFLGFLSLTEYSENSNFQIIFPSSGSCYSKTLNDYARCKLDMERYMDGRSNLGAEHLPIRIMAGYGEGEFSKGDRASIIYQFIQKARNNEIIEIYGDGNQTRDYIYIDDIVDGIISKVENQAREYQLGTGMQTSHNQIIKEIQKYYPDLKVKYIDKPKEYPQETRVECQSYYKPKVSISEGIKRLCE